MTFVLRGTATFPAGSGQQNRTLDIPASCVFGAVGQPTSYLSRVVVADPADTELFDHQGFSPIAGTTDSRDGYFGARVLQVQYELTGGSAVDVEFEIVWGAGDEGTTELQYAGS